MSAAMELMNGPHTVPEVLRAAARELELHGWFRGSFMERVVAMDKLYPGVRQHVLATQPTCALGAVGRVCGVLVYLLSDDPTPVLLPEYQLYSQSCHWLNEYVKGLGLTLRIQDLALGEPTFSDQPVRSIVAWNDYLAADGGEVRALLEKAAAAWEETH